MIQINQAPIRMAELSQLFSIASITDQTSLCPENEPTPTNYHPYPYLNAGKCTRTIWLLRAAARRPSDLSISDAHSFPCLPYLLLPSPLNSKPRFPNLSHPSPMRLGLIGRHPLRRRGARAAGREEGERGGARQRISPATGGGVGRAARCMDAPWMGSDATGSGP